MRPKKIIDWCFEHIVFLNPRLWPYRETFGRVLGILLCGIFFYLKGQLLFKLLIHNQEAPSFFLSGHTNNFSLVDLDLMVWALELTIVLVYIVAYLIREPAKNVAFGFREVMLPIFVATLPTFIVLSPESVPSSEYYLSIAVTAFSIMLIGALINLIALIQLRSAFSVMAEARNVTKHGLYHWVRHPMYAGHFLLFGGSLLFHWQWATIVAYVVFVIAQTYRAKTEEAKLEATFPHYKKYKARTGMFFPKWG